MPFVTEPVILDSTGRRIAENLADIRGEATPARRVATLMEGHDMASGRVVNVAGIPNYIEEEDISDYSSYGITESGWYAFARIFAKPLDPVAVGFSVTGAYYITPSIGADHVDVAVKFGVAAETKKVIVNWGEIQEPFYFQAVDLAIRNMDYRVTFYQYDLNPYCTWTWAAASGTFSADKSYYKLIDGEYVKDTTVVTGQTIPASTYYTHSGVTVSGFVKNISYTLDEIDCPITINLPEVEENYGAWFEVQTKFLAVYSITLTAVSPDKVSGKLVHSPKAGVDIINLMYHKPTKTWLPTITNWAAGV